MRAKTGASNSVSKITPSTLGTQAKNTQEIGILVALLNKMAKVTTLAVKAKRVATAQPIMP